MTDTSTTLTTRVRNWPWRYIWDLFGLAAVMIAVLAGVAAAWTDQYAIAAAAFTAATSGTLVRISTSLERIAWNTRTKDPR